MTTYAFSVVHGHSALNQRKKTLITSSLMLNYHRVPLGPEGDEEYLVI